ncbi:MAG: hypothetical protein R2795_02415 [Saprospiraceae bacterium]
MEVGVDAPSVLNCYTPVIDLNGWSNVPAPNAAYSWTTTNGEIIGNNDEATVQVAAAGTYLFMTEDTETGCSQSTVVNVMENTTPPIAEAGSAVALGCEVTSVSLNGAGSTLNNASYMWTTLDGQLLSGASTLTPTVGSTGTYTLIVTNNLNGCTATDQVTVAGDADVPSVQIIVSDTLDCQTTQMVLDASGSTSAAGYSFTWDTTNGHFVSGENTLTPLVDEPGVYTLTITNDANDCQSSNSVTVIENATPPVVNITPPNVLNCALQTVNIEATASGNNTPAYTYQWSTTNGSFVSRSNTNQPLVNAPGTYIVTVTNPANHCQSIASVEVLQNIQHPIFSIAAPPVLTCSQTNVTLNPQFNSPTSHLIYQWTTTNGNLTGNTTTATTSIFAPGNYTLTATDTTNFCTTSVETIVQQNITQPTADAGVDAILNCIQTSLALGGGNTSTGSTIQYLWTGLPQAPTNTESATTTIVAPGTYTLQVTDTSNGCTANDTVAVTQNVAPPLAQIAPPSLLTCTDSISLLDGTASSGLGILSYQWSTSNGSLVGNPSNVQLFAGQAGIYQLVITNNSNGCTDTATVTVQQDDNFPTAGVLPAQTLTCTRTAITLQGQANSQSGNTSFAWSTTDGQIVSGSETLQPVVNTPGNYLLVVTDNTNNCRAQASVQVVLDNQLPLADAGSDLVIDCSAATASLDGSLSDQGSIFTYSWTTTDGSILGANTSLQAIAATAGTYELVVTNEQNGCVASDLVTVAIDTLHPMINILPPAIITCSQLTTELESVIMNAGTSPVVQWSSLEGNPIQQANTATAIVTVGGNYEISVTNTDNGCTTVATTLVAQSTTPPVPQIETPSILTCVNLQTTLSALASMGDNLSYQWTTNEGQLLSGAETAMPIVDAPGMYSLLLTDASNGCQATAVIEVFQNLATPQLSIGTPDVLNCTQTTVSLLGNIVENGGAQPSILWNTLDGQIVSAADQLQIDVDMPGQYVLSVTHAESGCEETLSIMVTQNITAPIISLAPIETLDCTTLSVPLDASASTGNGVLAFNWLNNQLPFGNNTPSLEVMEAGQYGLLLVDTENGCTDSISFVVPIDTLHPIIMIDNPGILDCDTPSLTLPATLSNPANPFSALWSTQNGQIDAGINTLNPTISEVRQL